MKLRGYYFYQKFIVDYKITPTEAKINKKFPNINISD